MLHQVRIRGFSAMAPASLFCGFDGARDHQNLPDCRISGAAIKSRLREFKPPLRSLPAPAGQYSKAAAGFVSILTIHLSISNALLIVFYFLLRGERESAIFGAAIHLDCWTAAFAILRRRAQLSRRRFGRTWLLTAASTITCRRTTSCSSSGRSGIQV